MVNVELQQFQRIHFRLTLGNVAITCTATFDDGTQKSVNIKVKHQKLTGAQIHSSKFEKNKKYIFVTFEVEA